MKLTALKVKSLREPGKYGDGNGLWLVIGKTGTKAWTVRVTVDGRRREIGLGTFPDVSLAEARKKALAERQAASSGRDTIAERERAAIPTFEQHARDVHAAERHQWRSAQYALSWLRSLELHVFPQIGAKRLDDITRSDMIAVLQPVSIKTPETARRVWQRCSTVMRSAIAHEWIEHDPAGPAIKAAVPSLRGGNTKKVQAHQRAVPYGEVPAALEMVLASRASLASKLCMKFVVLTVTRSGEARGARWDEIDIGAETWTVPAERMKGGIEHRVPLVSQALDVLADARSLDDGSGLVFPSPLKPGQPLSAGTLLAVLAKLGIDSSVHGFRTAQRQHAHEQSGASWFVAEAVLAHKTGDATAQAYIRDADPFDERKKLMQQWAEFCLPPKPGAAAAD